MQYQPEQIPVSPAPPPRRPDTPIPTRSGSDYGAGQAPPPVPPVAPPPTPPGVPREFPWKTVIIFGGSGLVVALLVFGVVFLLVRGRRAPEAERPREEKGAAVSPAADAARQAAAKRAFEEAKAACANAADYETCLAAAALREATRGEVVELCDALTDSTQRDRCILEVALRRGDEHLCARASESVAAYCTSVFQSERAKRNDDLEACLAVPDALQRESCFAAIIATKDRAFCGTLPEELRERCAVSMIYRDAAGNPELCNELPDQAERESCAEDVVRESAASPPLDSDGDGLSDSDEATRGTNPGNPDTDGDGLSDGEEVARWQTDPKNADTDGDGFGDGTEVRAGYNPNGEGRL